MRIATLLPSATEIVAALGLADDVVAITHECDYPPEVRGRTVVVRPRVDSGLSSAAIDAQVEARCAGARVCTASTSTRSPPRGRTSS